MNTNISHWAEELSLFDDDMDRYQYLIDLAKEQTTLPQELCTKDRLVTGCMSNIWIDVGIDNNLVKVYYNSDAMITKGITHIICKCFDDLDLQTAKQITKEEFAVLGIDEILSGNRRSGLASLIGTIMNKVGAL